MNLKFVYSAVATVMVTGAVAMADDSASIKGKVAFDGTAPKQKPIKMDADPQCHAMHADKPMVNEEVLVNANGTLQNVFVYVKSGLSKTYEAPKDPVTINQQGCTYHPRVFGIQVKQTLLIKNSDDTLHNIHGVGTANDEFNKGQPAGSADLPKKFPKPEVMLKFKCDVHPWMTAYVGILEHPFYSVTGADGTFELKGLPAGEYEVVAWHEKYGEQSAKVKVGDGEAKAQDFTFKKPE